MSWSNAWLTGFKEKGYAKAIPSLVLPPFVFKVLERRRKGAPICPYEAIFGERPF